MSRFTVACAVLLGLAVVASANTQTTVQNDVNQGSATAKSAMGTIQKDAKLEGQDLVKIVEALLKKALGETNYKKLMAMISGMVKKIMAAVNAAKAKAGAIMQPSGSSTKPFMSLAMELAASSTQSTVSGAASAAGATAKSEAATLAKDAQKESNLVVKVVEAVLKKLLGEANYKKLMAVIRKIVAALKGAVGKAQQGVAALKKQMGGQALFQELNTQTTVQKDANAAGATAKSGAATLAKDAQKEGNILIKVVEVLLKKVLGEANYKKLMGLINQLFKAVQGIVGKVQKGAQGAVAAVQGAMKKGALEQELNTQSTVQGDVNAAGATAKSGAATLAKDAQKEGNIIVKMVEVILKKILGDANYKKLMAMLNQLVGAVQGAVGKAKKAVGGVVAGMQKSGGSMAIGQVLDTRGCTELIAAKRCDCFMKVNYCWNSNFEELTCGACA